jgi:hypothetical protein
MELGEGGLLNIIALPCKAVMPNFASPHEWCMELGGGGLLSSHECHCCMSLNISLHKHVTEHVTAAGMCHWTFHCRMTMSSLNMSLNMSLHKHVTEHVIAAWTCH